MSTGDDEPEDEPEPAADAADDDAAPADEESEAADEARSFDDRREETVAALDRASADDADEETLGAALDAIEAMLEASETEAHLDAVEEDLDQVADAIAAADLPEPDEEDEAAEDPRAALEDRVDELRNAVEEARGPYAEDVIAAIEEAVETVESGDWTEAGEADTIEAGAAFCETVTDILDADVAPPADHEGVAAAIEATIEPVEDADLDADADAETIAALLAATDGLTSDLEAAEEWSDLTSREQLAANGFYEVLDHVKDFPPEWHALKVWEQRGRVDMILLAFDTLEMDFMEEHCFDALRRMGHEEALEPMTALAERRNRPAIEVIGKIGSAEPVEMLLEYVDTDSDPQLQKVTLRALGEIGSREATGPIANKLVAENEIIRSHAARALGLLGDPRAIDPLGDVLETDEVGAVRASAAWALNQIGTERALDTLSSYADDRDYLVQQEAERAAEALASAPA